MAEGGEGPRTTLSKAIFSVQSALLELPRCTDRQLLAAGSLLSLHDYQDVVTERSISGLCGYPLCPNRLPTDRPQRKGRYRISLSQHRVYDIQETRSFCSEGCLIGSRAFAGTLEPERQEWMTASRVAEILVLFGDSSDALLGPSELGFEKLSVKGEKVGGDLAVQGEKTSDDDGKERGGEGFAQKSLGEDGDLGLSKLTIRENLDTEKAEEMLMEEWTGPSNAIDGYVPHQDRKREFKPKPKPERRDQKQNKKTSESFTDFTSEIIFDDGFYASTKEASPSSIAASESLGLGHRSGTSGTRAEMDFASTLLVGKTQTADDKLKAYSASSSNLANWQGCGLEGEDGCKRQSKGLKSSLKQPGSKGKSHSVKWADEEEGMASSPGEVELDGVGSSDNLNEQVELGGMESSDNLNELDDEGSYRLASAEACASALMQASEAVSLGESETEDAVSDAGILILPPLEHDDQEESDEDESLAFIRSYEKWPKKRVLVDTDMFAVEDSWHDTPPEGFNLTLSSFANMWMALFGWVTCSSVAYIYGRGEDSQHEFICVNGKEYPQKVCLSDGRSSEIKKTLAGCVARALPQVVSDFRLPTPVSIIEKAMANLLDTMSFMDAIPPFKTKEWHIIVLLFIDALSVVRIPTLATHMINKRNLLHQVLRAAQIRADEYQIMKDLMIPLGRAPQFSVQSGA